MLRDSNKRAWDFVLVYKLDRFSRNKYEMAIHKKHLKDNGIKLVSVMENIPDGPEGILLESLLEGMNQYYSEELSQKTKRGMNETRLQGNFIGGNVNFGYYRKQENDAQGRIILSKKLFINEDEAEVLVKIFNQYSQGVTVSQITRDLNQAGLTCRGRVFKECTINNFLRQEKYTGIYRVNGNAYDKIYPKIIEPEIYEMCKARLEKNRHGNKQKDHAVFYLRKKTHCGYCGSKMRAVSAIQKDGQYLRYYKCAVDTTERTGKHNKTILKDNLESMVQKALLQMMSNERSLNIFADAIIEARKKQMVENATLNILKNDLMRVNKSIANIMSAIEQGIFTETTKNRLEELEAKKKELTESILINKTKEPLNLRREDIVEFFKYAQEQQPEEMFNILINDIRIYNDKIEIKLNFTRLAEINNENGDVSMELFTEQFPMTRKFRGSFKVVGYHEYKVFVIM